MLLKQRMFPKFVYLHAYCTINRTTNTAGQQSRFNIAIFVSARRVLRLTDSASLLYGIVASPVESGHHGPRRQKTRLHCFRPSKPACSDTKTSYNGESCWCLPRGVILFPRTPIKRC